MAFVGPAFDGLGAGWGFSVVVDQAGVRAAVVVSSVR